MKHELRLEKSLFVRVKSGVKNFLIKSNDRNFQFGDTVLIKEWDDDSINPTSSTQKGYTGQELEFNVGFVEVLGSSQVCFSLLPTKTKR
jgi:hypothetical protein